MPVSCKRKGIVLFLILANAFLAAALTMFSACGPEGSKGSGEGITGDVGNGCSGLCLDANWCFDSNYSLCVSFYCVGSVPDEMYCTVECETQAQCPDGYNCTDNCTLDSSAQPYCVTSSDYQHLQEMGNCGEPLG
jgi:hypothetical protein